MAEASKNRKKEGAARGMKFKAEGAGLGIGSGRKDTMHLARTDAQTSPAICLAHGILGQVVLPLS